ncbi:hypothetical protein J1N35_045093 [Gossypium stocksii]|uniref:Uncharacterized protein n=1 Tax=Gossypium stocksii TaxID=47602 RepID=A0A9D3UAH4_9ROSI|nr:hypothetical protein J1N35_045093 [Gossypium stocksii]
MCEPLGFVEPLGSVENKLAERDDALEAMMTTLKEEIMELKGELTIYKVALGNGGFVATPKPKEFKGTMFARDVHKCDMWSRIWVRKRFFSFMDGLKPWVKQKLQRRGVQELTKAMTIVESFVKLGLKKEKLESFKHKLKPMGNGGGDKDKLAKNDNGDDEATKNLSSILGGVKDKSSNWLMFVDIIIAGRKLNALVDTGALDLFMSKETTRDLRFKIKKESHWIKIVNSKSVEIEGVAIEMELQLGDWTGKDIVNVIPLDNFKFA